MESSEKKYKSWSVEKKNARMDAVGELLLKLSNKINETEERYGSGVENFWMFEKDKGLKIDI